MGVTIEKEIDLINDIISAAIYHGGDMGGAYYSDWFGLETAIGEWLSARGLADSYTPYKDKIVSIRKVSAEKLCCDEYMWYLRIPAVDDSGCWFSALQKWEEIKNDGLYINRPGVKFQLARGKEGELEGWRFSQEGPECIVRVDIVRAEFEGACEFYQVVEDGQVYVESIAPEYLSICNTKVAEINAVLAWSGYEVSSTKSDWCSITLRNFENGRTIQLFADGRIGSEEMLSAELTDALHKAHDIYWVKD